MAWIESHQELAHHPKVARLANALNVHKAAALGHLHMFWWWCLSYAEDGDVTEFDAYELADGAQWSASTPEEFVTALQAAGWIDSADGRLTVHDWWEYAGKLVERRRSDAERKRKDRQKTSGGSPEDVRTDGVRTQPNPTVPNQTAAAFQVFHKQRAVEETQRRKSRGRSIDNITAYAKAIAEDSTFYKESERIWQHRDCAACKGTGSQSLYSEGSGGIQVPCREAT